MGFFYLFFFQACIAHLFQFSLVILVKKGEKKRKKNEPYLFDLFSKIGSQFSLCHRFDGRALLDFIRDPGSRHFRAQEKSEEEEELEEFVNFERYRDLIKHRRRGCRYFFFNFLMMS